MMGAARTSFRHLSPLLAITIILNLCPNGSSSGITVENRHLYSLTTFHSDGKLSQVERAVAAASHGVPILATITDHNELILVAPQFLPSPFLCIDDGTRRFARITSTIVVAHTGLSADGRVLVTAAQRCAIEHEYTFEEEMGITKFLDEMSLLMQEATMTPGQRPFGASLLVAHVPQPERDAAWDGMGDDDDDDTVPAQLYRIDPSGSVQAMGNTAVMNANPELQQAVERATKQKDVTLAEREESMIEILHATMMKSEASPRDTEGADEGNDETDMFVSGRPPCVILTASLSSDGTFSKAKHELND